MDDEYFERCARATHLSGNHRSGALLNGRVRSSLKWRDVLRMFWELVKNFWWLPIALIVAIVVSAYLDLKELGRKR